MSLANEIKQMVARREAAHVSVADLPGDAHNVGSLHWELDGLTALLLMVENPPASDVAYPLAQELAPYLRELATTIRSTVGEGRRIANHLERHCPNVSNSEGIPNKSISQQLRWVLGVFKD